MTDVYRRCAAMVVLRQTAEGDFEVLLVHKPRKNDAWQLPQGGAEEGESLEQAASRELEEEAGIKAEVTGKSDQVYQYDFPASYRRFRPDKVCGQRVEFVFGRVDSDIEVKVDGHEIDKHDWVKKEDIKKHIVRPEYLAVVENLFDEARAVNA